MRPSVKILSQDSLVNRRRLVAREAQDNNDKLKMYGIVAATDSGHAVNLLQIEA